MNCCENVDSIGIPANTDLYVVFLKKKLYKKNCQKAVFLFIEGLPSFH